MSVLTFKKDENSAWYDIYVPSGKSLGYLSTLEDGFYYFFSEDGRFGGGWDAWVLRQIADKLDELNKPWEDHINETIG